MCNITVTARNRLIKLELDTPAADAAIQAAQALQGGVSAEQKASVEVLLNTIRSSRMWPKYLEMQKEYKVRHVCLWVTPMYVSLLFDVFDRIPLNVHG